MTQPTLAIPAAAGVGLRSAHVPAFLARDPATDWTPAAWLEVHAENYFAPGGPRIDALDRLRRDFPLSVHGVGLSLGSAGGLDRDHLAGLKRVVDRFQPGLVSEHIAWSVADGVYLNDLLPLPYTEESLAVLAANIDHAQDALGRPILVENPSTYVAFAETDRTEWDFIAELVRRTGCGLLLDVNNIHVSAHNHGYDAAAYVAGIPTDAIGEIHVSGHAVETTAEGEVLLIDTHGSPVADPVWALLDAVLAVRGPVPVLVEWDSALPPVETLLGEAARANRHLARSAIPTTAQSAGPTTAPSADPTPAPTGGSRHAA